MKEYIQLNNVLIALPLILLFFFGLHLFNNSEYKANCICGGMMYSINQPNSNISQACYDICINENITGQRYHLKDVKCEYNEEGKYFENVKFGATALWGCGL